MPSPPVPRRPGPTATCTDARAPVFAPWTSRPEAMPSFTEEPVPSARALGDADGVAARHLARAGDVPPAP